MQPMIEQEWRKQKYWVLFKKFLHITFGTPFSRDYLLELTPNIHKHLQ